MVLDLQTDKQVFLHRHQVVFQMPLKLQVHRVLLSKSAKTKDQNSSAIWVGVSLFGEYNSNETSSLVRNGYTHCSFYEALCLSGEYAGIINLFRL